MATRLLVHAAVEGQGCTCSDRDKRLDGTLLEAVLLPKENHYFMKNFLFAREMKMNALRNVIEPPG